MVEINKITYKQKRYLEFLIPKAKDKSFQENLDIDSLSIGEASELIAELLEERE